MSETLYRDWPVYVLLAGVVFFFGYVIIKSNLPEKKNKDGQSNKEFTKKE